ncbi:MAG TPA: hypothetical protein VHN78_00955, partial [Chloroflexota bacterium]|nr:hypothetical protein [Chloroflexota bacterium]
MTQVALQAGYGVVDITPPPGVDLTGFIAREGPCVGTLDPLQARALVFRDGRGRRAALVTCDLIGLGRHLVARVRRRVAEATGIPAPAQLFACSHTHAGPETGVLSTIGIPDPSYLAELEQRLVEVILAADGALVPVRLGLAATEVPDGLVVNRVYRRIGRPHAVDRQLTVVSLGRAGDAAGAPPLATIVAFACHAVALGATERHASADFVAHLRRELEGRDSGPVLYVNGCGGDINPAGMDARGRDTCAALGEGLARAAATALEAAREGRAPDSPAVVETAQEWVPLPFQPLRDVPAVSAILGEGRRGLAELPPGS